MPVEGNTQPFGLLHGGASVVLAETLGSIGSAIHAYPAKIAVGVDINATHHRAATSGLVTGVATADPPRPVLDVVRRRDHRRAGPSACAPRASPARCWTHRSPDALPALRAAAWSRLSPGRARAGSAGPRGPGRSAAGWSPPACACRDCGSRARTALVVAARRVACGVNDSRAMKRLASRASAAAAVWTWLMPWGSANRQAASISALPTPLRRNCGEHVRRDRQDGPLEVERGERRRLEVDRARDLTVDLRHDDALVLAGVGGGHDPGHVGELLVERTAPQDVTPQLTQGGDVRGLCHAYGHRRPTHRPTTSSSTPVAPCRPLAAPRRDRPYPRWRDQATPR